MRVPPVALALLALASPAMARSPACLTRRWSNAPGDVAVTLGGATFVDHGLVAVGRLSAATRDFNGETLGSFSGRTEASTSATSTAPPLDRRHPELSRSEWSKDAHPRRADATFARSRLAERRVWPRRHVHRNSRGGPGDLRLRAGPPFRDG